MKKEDLIKRFKQDPILQNFIWRAHGHGVDMIYCLGVVGIDSSYEGIMNIPNTLYDQIERVYKQKEPTTWDTTLGRLFEYFNPQYTDSNENIKIAELTSQDVECIVTAIFDWKQKCDALKVDPDENKDQLVVIHENMDDWNAQEILRDFRFIVSDDNESWAPRLGVISSKKWNFGNDDFLWLLQRNSEDCFGVGSISRDELFGEYELGDLYNKLKQLYPNLDNIHRIYATDWD